MKKETGEYLLTGFIPAPSTIRSWILKRVCRITASAGTTRLAQGVFAGSLQPFAAPQVRYAAPRICSREAGARRFCSLRERNVGFIAPIQGQRRGLL